MTLLLTVLLILAQSPPETIVSLPDTVATGEPFTVDISITGPDLFSAECVPEFSSGLVYYGTSTSQSFSSVSTPSGTTISSRMTISLSFIARTPGSHEVGPISITAQGMGRMELPPHAIYAVLGAAPDYTPRSLPDPVEQRPHNSGPVWVVAEMDTSGTVYPGCPFYVDYYACTKSRNVQSIQTTIDGCSYASARMVDSPEQLLWRKVDKDVRRSLLLRMEVTPAFACTLSLPVIAGTVIMRSGPFETEYSMTPSEGSISVYPFPDRGMPSNFTGIADSISFTLEEDLRGYSLAGERNLLLTAAGPGTASITSPPTVTVSGPATLETCTRNDSGDRIGWQLLAEPSDSGSVIFGPDSVAWFHREDLVYRQATVPACTLHFRAPSATITTPELPENGGGSGYLVPILLGIGLLAAAAVFVIRRRVGTGIVRSVEEASDTEELLTLLESRLSSMLTGTSRYMGAEELAKALDDRSVDGILSRRVLRHWKDIEMSLSGSGSSPDRLNRLRLATVELLEELSAELEQQGDI